MGEEKIMNIYELFEQIDESKIRQYIDDGQEENLYLEFKTITHADLSWRDDRKNFAKALSGFANSSGGLIIWGVKATKNSEGIDCACGGSEIKSISLFLSKLNEFTGTFVTPIVDDVKHKKIETSNDSGFAITIIPQSDSGPHMADAGEDRYYKRSGDSFYKMEHFDIEDMFGRRKKPKLSLYTDIIPHGKISGPPGTTYQFAVIIGIENTGRGTAKYPYLSLIVKKPYQISGWGLDGNRRTGLPKLVETPRGDKTRFGSNANIVIHPASILNVTTIEGEILESVTTLEDVQIDAEISAEDIRMVKQTVIIPGNEIIAKIK